MRLRAQLIIVSLCMLLLPWAGCQFVIDMEHTLRQGQTQALSATAAAVAARLENDERLLEYVGNTTPETPVLYAATTANLTLDGYDDDWGTTATVRSASGSASLRLGASNNYLYLLLDVKDSALNYHNPSAGSLINSDYIALRINQHRYVIRTAAPGNVAAFRETGGGWQRDVTVRGVWLETELGYRAELRLRLPGQNSSFAVAAVDYPANTGQHAAKWHWFGKALGQEGLAQLQYRRDELDAVLNQFAGENLHISAADIQGWLVGQAGAINHDFAVEGQHNILTWLYKWVLRSRDIAQQPVGATQSRLSINGTHGPIMAPDSRWYYRGSSLVGSSIVPLYDDDELRGAVRVEQSTNDLLAMTSSAFNRLFLYTFIGTFGAVLLLFTYASWLSFRIRRLSIAAKHTLQEDGNIHTQLPSVRSADELGDLARSYQQLLEQVQEYTSYLRTLSDKLSHELRTPLAVVKSSLDNLDSLSSTDEQAVYIHRAQSGVSRLSSMLTAMSAAKRIEESFEGAALSPTDMHSLLHKLLAAYQQTYARASFSLEVEPIQLALAPELFVQLLDKLIDNAVDFCEDGGAIAIRCFTHNNGVQLMVSNDGPLLPQAMSHQLFDSLVSQRSKAGAERVHMGLGLHIVKLIAQFHGASVRACNRADGSGVEFWVTFSEQSVV